MRGHLGRRLSVRDSRVRVGVFGRNLSSVVAAEPCMVVDSCIAVIEVVLFPASLDRVQ